MSDNREELRRLVKAATAKDGILPADGAQAALVDLANAVPALLAELAALQAENERLGQALDDLRSPLGREAMDAVLQRAERIEADLAGLRRRVEAAHERSHGTGCYDPECPIRAALVADSPEPAVDHTSLFGVMISDAIVEARYDDSPEPVRTRFVDAQTIYACFDAEHDVGMRHEDGSLYSATCHDCGYRYHRDSPEPAERTCSRDIGPVPLTEPERCEHGETGGHVYGEVVSSTDAHWRPRWCPGPVQATTDGAGR